MKLPESGRRVLVSGASRGLGRAVAQAFAAHGDRVAVHFASRADEARVTLESLDGTGHTLVGGDLADPAGAVAVADAAAEALGGIDVLVNNAAVNLRHPLPETPYEEWAAVWQQHVSVNLLATANLSHLAARRMIDQGSGGRIVNIGSRGAFRGEPDHPAYGATKAAVHALGQSLAVSLAPYGIAVSSVAPDSSPPNGSRPAWRAPREPRSAPRARSAGWPSPPKSRRPSCGSRRPPRNGRPGRSSTSTEHHTSAVDPDPVD